MIHAAVGRWGARVSWADAAAALGLLLVGALYFWQLDGWLINDDEGSYLYAAWRISLGELPYRDFLTPQLPAFLLPGGLLMRVVGPDVWPARALAVLLTLGAGVAVWATARRLFGAVVALLAGSALLLHPAVFLACRTYRPEPFMLFFAAFGVLLFARGAFPHPGTDGPPDRRWLAIAGGVFGLATLSKLFGPLPLAGCLAWLVADGYVRRRPVGGVARDVGVVVAAWGLVLAVGIGVFLLSSREVYDAVLGHHLRQGSGQGVVTVASKGLGFYGEFVREGANGLLAFVAIAVGWTAWRARDRVASLFAWQLPTVLGFLLLSRQLFSRHMIYLVPAMATLFALGVWWLAEEGRRQGKGPGRGDRWRWLAGALAAALLVPWLINDWHQAWEWEAGTGRMGDFIGLVTENDEIVLSDYSELNFYSGRPTTHSGASLSAGAAGSGQISWALPESPNRLRDELGDVLPPLLIVDTAEQFGHLRFLRDRDDFEAWVEAQYGPEAGRFTRHHQTYAVYAPRERPLPVLGRFDGGPALLAAAADRSGAGSGESVEVATAWRADEAPYEALGATVRLVDGAGREWAQANEVLEASGTGGARVRRTDAWAPGELTADRVALEIPPGTPPGDYTLQMGLYRLDDLTGLDVTGPDGAPLGRRVPVGTVRVDPWQVGPSAIPGEALDLVAESDPTDGLRLLGRGPLSEEAVEAGTTFPLELWWHAEGPEEDLAVRVTLGDPSMGSVAASWTEALGVPGAGSSTWPDDGVLVRQVLRVPVLADAVGGTFDLGVSVVDADGRPRGDALPVELGTVAVVARDLSAVVTESPAMGRTLDATFGTVAELVGADVPARGAPGDALDVTLVWRALATPPVAYKVSVQLLDADGNLVAVHDAEPADWQRPTTGWLPGEYITDPHTLAVPEDLAPGRYHLVAAMYDPETLVRLPVTGADAAGGGVADLGAVEVQ